MRISENARAALLAIALCNGAAAQAVVLTFTGDLTALSSGFVDPSCAPKLFRSIVSPGNGSGTSSFGNFGYTSLVCQSPGGPVSGVFALSFADGGFQGTLTGNTSPTGTPRIFSPKFSYAILSGTGRFLNSTGNFLGTGSIDARTPPSRFNFLFNGLVDAPAVPEPATWSMMLAGFGAAGWSLRWRRAQNRLSAAA